MEKIVEQKDATPEEARTQEINTGTYCFDNEQLFAALEKIGTNNAQGEYYLTDIVEILKNDGQTVAAYKTDDFEESLGVNDRIALANANELMRRRINKQHMVNGVTFIDPATTYIDAGINIGSDTIIEPGVQIQGNTVIGSDCIIGAHSKIVDSTIEDKVEIKSSVIEEAIVRKNADVGPHAHLRPKADIGENAHIGNYVEIKKATIGENTKVVGCGVVFVNYDGKNKHHTNVGDHVFIGSGTNIIAPVTIAENSVTAAGSTITDDIAEGDMAIARARQVNKEGYASRLPF